MPAPLPRPVPAAILLALLGATLPAHAAEYWTKQNLLGDFFKTSQSVKHHAVTLSDADAAEIGKQLGRDLPTKSWQVYIAEADGKRTGYAILDAEIGLHEPIDFGVRFGLNGAVDRVEITVYREPFGDEVRGAAFRGQFIGKTAKNPIVAGQDIDIVSGATYSSKSMALGVKRDVLVLQAALKNGL